MTPLEAFIKNVLTIGLLVWLYKLLPSSKNESWKRIIYPILIFLACALFMFMAYPFCPCEKEKVTEPIDIEKIINEPEDVINEIDSVNNSVSESTELSAEEKQQIKDSLNLAKKNLEAEEAARKKAEKERLAKEAEAAKQAAASGPKPKVSRFAALPTFSGKTIKVDEGKKTICMFAPGCDHCQHTAKLLGELAKKGNTPPVYIYFMDEEPEKIPEFFKKAGATFPYQILSIGNFWDLLSEGTTPGVIGLWNGNIQQSYEGISENEFDLEKFKEFALPKK